MAGHAVVVGAGVAGLLAARVLARHFDAVTLVERDVPDAGREAGPQIAARKGVPQGHHIHLLWSGGMQAIEHLFPGVGTALQARGGVVFDNSRDMRWYHHGVWKLRHPSGLRIHAQSRPMLEQCLREHLLASPGVRVLPGRMLVGLEASSAGRITGVRLRAVGGGPDAGEETTLGADLVVDASGRSAATLPCLEALGHARPREETIGVDIGYATQVFRAPSAPRDWQAMAVYATAPRSHRLGVIFPIEGARWIVTLVGLRGHYPRSDEPQAFLDFAASLEQPDLHEAICDAVPEGPVRLIRYATQLRRRFDQLDAPPPGVLHLGDSVCSLNPLYGQGMTLCALEATILDDCLNRARGASSGQLDASFARDYYERVGTVVDAAWKLGAGSDFLYPETSGERPWWSGPMGWYLRKVLVSSARSELVQQRFLEVIHFRRPLTGLLRPDVIMRVLVG